MSDYTELEGTPVPSIEELDGRRESREKLAEIFRKQHKEDWTDHDERDLRSGGGSGYEM